jgi:hypothetical protein
MVAVVASDQGFAQKKYVVCRSLLKEPALSHHYKYALIRASSGRMDANDAQVPHTPSAHGDLMMDGLLSDLVPLVEQASGLQVFPTYSYFRVYKSGDVLKKHTDRPSCEISATLCLGFRAPKAWPIWIEGPDGAVSVELQPGDGLLYRGVECPHWRDAFEGEHQAQVFLHYVDQTGPYAEWKFDKRSGLTTVAALR